MTSKTSRKSGLSVTNMEDVIKFKLVEDLSLVTIPITTCLLVLLGRIYIFSSWFLWSDVGLLGYILFGAALFSVWEVCKANSDIKINYIVTYSQGWSILDGAYFCFTSLMTIGFGDFVPGNSYIYNKTGSISEVHTGGYIIYYIILYPTNNRDYSIIWYQGWGQF